MPRRARVVLPDTPHHITQRGVRRSQVFLEDDDRHLYSRLLLATARKHGVAVLAYCWMANHVHVVAVPSHEDSLAKTFRRVHSIYAQAFNRKYGYSGYLWQGPPYSCPLDSGHARSAIRYVERNPVRVGLVIRAEEYQWSSAQAHCGLASDALVAENDWPTHTVTKSNWARWLSDPDDPIANTHIRQGTRTGRPCGSDAFVDQVERQTGLSLRAKPRGRRKSQKSI
jgi:putative transposase